MDIFSTIEFLERGKARTSEDLTPNRLIRQQEYKTAKMVARSIAAYRQLDAQEGEDLARRAVAFLEANPGEDAAIAEIILTRLATIVPGSLKGLYPQLIEMGLFCSDGILFCEADAVTRDRLLMLLQEQSVDNATLAGSVCALSWIGDLEVQDRFSFWKRAEPSWLSTLAQPLDKYMRLAGWEMTKDGIRRDLYYRNCYELIPAFNEEGVSHSKPIRVVLPREDRCGGCGRHLFTLFDLDLTDSRLGFLELDGLELNIATCPTDIAFGETLFTDVDLLGSSTWSDANGERVVPLDDLDDWEDFPQLPFNQLTLGSIRRTPLETYAAYQQKGLSQIGGHPEWVPYPDYPRCPSCQQTMMFVGQLELADVRENSEGMIYAFHCRSCGKAATMFQQT